MKFFTVFAAIVIPALVFGFQQLGEREEPLAQIPVVEDAGDYEWKTSVGVTQVLTERDLEFTAFPNDDTTALIKRLADGLSELMLRTGGWWICGEHFSDEDVVRRLALEHSYILVRAAHDESEKCDFELNVWGMAGLIFHESRFDRCALGPHPRKLAYEIGILKPSRRTLSHTEEEILKALEHPRMKAAFRRTGVDIGIGQMLSRFYEVQDYRHMLSLEGGTREAARELRYRGLFHRTDRPWATWPGYYAEWYDSRIVGRSRELGATSADL
jgi:hypothetical protein